MITKSQNNGHILIFVNN